MLQVEGNYQVEWLALLEFIVTQAPLQRSVTVKFIDNCRRNGAIGEYLPHGAPDYPYKKTGDVVYICTKHEHAEVLKTIAHEFKHIEQSHYNLFPSEWELIKRYQETGNEWERHKYIKLKEKEAKEAEVKTIAAWKANKGETK